MKIEKYNKIIDKIIDEDLPIEEKLIKMLNKVSKIKEDEKNN